MHFERIISTFLEEKRAQLLQLNETDKRIVMISFKVEKNKMKIS